MSQARALVDALAAVAPRFSPEDRREKLRLLAELAGCPVPEPVLLLRLHESLCFLQAYPDDPAVLDRVDRALRDVPARVERLRLSARARLRDTGIAATVLDYPFGLPMTRWLLSRFPAEVDVAWEKLRGAEQLEETLSALVSPAEDDLFSEGGPGWRHWLRLAKGKRPLRNLELLVELFDRADLPEAVRDWLFESLGLLIRWRLSGPVSRTQAKLAWGRPFFHRRGLRRTGFAFLREVERRLPTLRRAPEPLARTLIEAARAALATRLRELHAFSHPNPDDVLVADPGRGLRIVLIGLLPGFRLPLEGYYAFLVLKNGVPVSYGGGWELFGTIELGFNVFPSFRQGESAFILSQVLRAYRQALGIRTVVLDPYQLGRDNPEALRSGAFYFYHRLGFRPRHPRVLGVSTAEIEKLAREPGYRSPLSILKQLARAELYLTLRGGSPAPERRLRASQVAALVTRHIARDFGGDRGVAMRQAPPEVARALGASGWTSWPREERRAFERLALVASVIPDLAAWPHEDRRALVRVMRAKGGRSELEYVRLLGRHGRFRRTLETLVGFGGAGSVREADACG